MSDNTLKVFIDQPDLLEKVNVGDLNELVDEVPSSDLYRLLLAQKSGDKSVHNFALTSSDRMMGSEYLFGEGVLTKARNEFLSGSYTNRDQRKESVPVVEENDKLIEREPTLDDKVSIDISTESESNMITRNLSDASEPSLEPTQLVDSEPEPIITEPLVITDTDETENIMKKEMESENSDLVQDIPSHTMTQSDDVKKEKKEGRKKKKNKFKMNEYAGLSDYALWLLSFSEDDLETKIKKEEEKAKRRKFKEEARNSILKSDTIISEPLAEILVNQGHFDDAIKMYEQLMHKNKEKSSYFAAKIENLLKK